MSDLKTISGTDQHTAKRVLIYKTVLEQIQVTDKQVIGLVIMNRKIEVNSRYQLQQMLPWLCRNQISLQNISHSNGKPFGGIITLHLNIK